MKAAKLVKVPDNIRRGVNGLPGSGPDTKGGTYVSQPTSTSSVNTEMQGAQNGAVQPVSVKKVDFKDLRTGQDFRHPQRDTVAPNLGKISNDPGPRSPNPNNEGLGG
jgi:hypothetical protein